MRGGVICRHIASSISLIVHSAHKQQHNCAHSYVATIDGGLKGLDQVLCSIETSKVISHLMSSIATDINVV